MGQPDADSEANPILNPFPGQPDSGMSKAPWNPEFGSILTRAQFEWAAYKEKSA